LLDDARTPVLSGAAASLGTTEVAWASFTGTATPDRAMGLVTTVNCGATACLTSWNKNRQNAPRKGNRPGDAARGTGFVALSDRILHTGHFMDRMSAVNVIVYTVITQGYDSLAEITPEPSVEYWLFTDDASIATPPFWNKSVLANDSGLNARRLSRLPKLRPHVYLPAHEVSIYLDGSMRLRQPVAEFATDCVWEMPLAVHRHPRRECIYTEAEKCLRGCLKSLGCREPTQH
jgi:hypothetical protein